MTRPDLPKLPVSRVLGEIVKRLDDNPNLVLVAPPGAGKTTLVPLALIEAAWCAEGRIIVLEPRRLAARAAARRMADLLGEQPGGTVGYRIRLDSRIGRRTRVEVVTEGVFGRMLADDPGLEGVAAVIFDEFHERSLDGDFSLALCLDLQEALRPDLRLLVMSATLDGASVAELMAAEVIESQGRSYSIEVQYREREPHRSIEICMANAVLEEVRSSASGSVLTFLPGRREIEKAARLLEGQLPDNVDLHCLYGALPPARQDLAIAPPAAGRRKVVLSSAIAETSLTIEDVTTVIDSGLARQPVFEPATGLTRLQTVRASLASVNQRAGRAGRLGPGRVVRLWRKQQTAALPAHTPPEVLNADLAPLRVGLADWGVRNPSQLKWLDKPPEPAFREAGKLLTGLGALGEDGSLTAHGRAIAALPLPPRYAHMVIEAGQCSPRDAVQAALLALLVQEHGVGGRSVDMDERLLNVSNAADARSAKLKKLARSIAERVHAGSRDQHSSAVSNAGMILARGLFDRIARRRGPGPSGTMRFLLANGRGAELEATEELARQEFIVVVDMTGRAGAARILSAAALARSDLWELFGDRFENRQQSSYDKQADRLWATQSVHFGAVEITRPETVTLEPEAARQALVAAVIEHGSEILPWSNTDRQLRARLRLLHELAGEPWPDISEATLIGRIEEWLAPFLSDVTSFSQLPRGCLSNGLLLLAGYPAEAELNRLTPTHFEAPSGSRIPLEYKAGRAVLSVRPQELFGLDNHPHVLDGKLPIDVELLSPARRPIQITRDLPGFWRGSWQDVRADMRGRYPKHPWPQNPLEALPTSRAKRRGGQN